MKTPRILLLALFCLPMGLWSCKEPADPNPEAEVTLNLQHTFADQPLALHHLLPVREGLAVELTQLQYYVSNIRLKRRDGTWWAQPESYHLVTVEETGDPAFTIGLGALPAGDYTELALGLGVDAHRNHQGEQTGALDPLNGMLWTWESGYKFFRAEGFYHTPQASNALIIHVGRDDCYREVTLPLPAASQHFGSGEMVEATLEADIRKLFGGYAGAAYTLSPPADGGPVSVMAHPDALHLSQNYGSMLSLKEVVKVGN